MPAEKPPPGIGAPPSAPDTSNQPDETDDNDDSQPASSGGRLGGGPAVDSYGNSFTFIDIGEAL